MSPYTVIGALTDSEQPGGAISPCIQVKAVPGFRQRRRTAVGDREDNRESASVQRSHRVASSRFGSAVMVIEISTIQTTAERFSASMHGRRPQEAVSL